MSFLLSYAGVLVFGLVSFVVFVNTGTATGHMLASAGGYGIQDLEDLPFYALAAAGALGVASVVKIGFSGFPQLMRGRHGRNLGVIAMLVMVCAFGAVLVIA